MMSGSGSVGPTARHESSGVIETSYACVVVRSWDEAPLTSAVPEQNTLVTIPDDTELNELWVHTGDQWGPFAVTTRLLDARPTDPGAAWEDVVELSITTDGPLIVTEVVENDPQIELVHEPGTYRLRISARGRRIPDGAAEDDDPDDHAPTREFYLLEVWPAPTTTLAILRLTSPYAQQALHPPPPLVIPEGEAGLAASVRIGRRR